MEITPHTQNGTAAATMMSPEEGACGSPRDFGTDTNSDSGCELRVIRDKATWDTLEAEWKALFAASPAASPPLRWEWLRIWWDVYAPFYALHRNQDEGLRILTVWRGAQLIGALPLYIRRPRNMLSPRRLGFLSTGEAEHEETCAENLNLLYLPDAIEDCLQQMSLFFRDTREWDELDLTGIAAGSPLLTWTSQPPGQLDVTLREQGRCYVGDLTGGFEPYLQRLSRNGRSQARRALKSGDNTGVRFEVAADTMQAEQMLTQLIALHQARWQARGKPGAFASPRFEAFHRALLAHGIEKGYAVLTRLSTNHEPLAMVLGYSASAKFDCYVHGTVTEERDGIKSPGITGQMLLHQYILSRGITRYDHLGGEAFYKQVLSTETTPLWHLYACRRTPRMATHRMVNTTRRAAKAGKNLATAPRPAFSRAWKRVSCFGYAVVLSMHDRALALMTWQQGLHGIALSLLACQEMLVDY